MVKYDALWLVSNVLSLYLSDVGDAALVKPLQGLDQFCSLDHWTTPTTTATPLPSTINTFVYNQQLSRLQAAARVTFDMSFTSAIFVLLEIDLFFLKKKIWMKCKYKAWVYLLSNILSTVNEINDLQLFNRSMTTTYRPM